MKIAIVLDKDRLLKFRLSEIFEKLNWKADFYYGSSDFGLVDISNYDVIIADTSLKPVDGRQILHSIQNKTQAELFLIGTEQFSEIDINNENIKGLLNKDNVEDIVDKLKYVLMKKRMESTLKASAS